MYRVLSCDNYNVVTHIWKKLINFNNDKYWSSNIEQAFRSGCHMNTNFVYWSLSTFKNFTVIVNTKTDIKEEGKDHLNYWPLQPIGDYLNPR
jgi:hypothetical protein